MSGKDRQNRKENITEANLTERQRTNKYTEQELKRGLTNL